MKRIALLAALSAAVLSAQLAVDQKLQDFENLAAMYAKQYAPYEWKRDALGFDLLKIKPWLDRVRASKSDIEFYEICAEYVASLNDAHDVFNVPSTYSADLGFDVDIYDGKYLIETIFRGVLPISRYPFEVGDELVSIDGKPAAEINAGFAKISAYANKRSTDRWNAQFLTFRPQTYVPNTALLAEEAVVVIKRASGSTESYRIPWLTDGLPLINNGPVPSPFSTLRDRGRRGPVRDEPADDEVIEDTPLPEYMKVWVRMQQQTARGRTSAIARKPRREGIEGEDTPSLRGFGVLTPYYTLPTGFVIRRGRGAADYFYSGTYASGGKSIGFIRIADFQPVAFQNLQVAINQFDTEIAYMKANTDALVVDVTRNPGGFGCYAQTLASRLIPYNYHGVTVEIRPTLSWVNDFYDTWLLAEDLAPGSDIAALYEMHYNAVAQAYSENRGRTGAVPLCSAFIELPPVRDSTGNVFAYAKPLLVLTDEFSTSAGDIFPALLQDAGRGKQFGFRTAGAGGSVEAFGTGFYSEASASVTQSMILRRNPVKVPGFPEARYVENVGVHPDIVYDYQTADNLRTRGAGFVEAFTQAVLALIP